MNKTWVYIITGIVIVVLFYLGYKWINSAKVDVVTPDQPSGPIEGPSFDPGNEDPSSETTRNSEGQTIVNINKGNYRGQNFDKYYITYTGPGGSAVEELCNEGYTRFMVDNPSGTAQGNVISKYAR